MGFRILTATLDHRPEHTDRVLRPGHQSLDHFGVDRVISLQHGDVFRSREFTELQVVLGHRRGEDLRAFGEFLFIRLRDKSVGNPTVGREAGEIGVGRHRGVG